MEKVTEQIFTSLRDGFYEIIPFFLGLLFFSDILSTIFWHESIHFYYNKLSILQISYIVASYIFFYSYIAFTLNMIITIIASLLGLHSTVLSPTEKNYLAESIKENNPIKYEHYKQLKTDVAKFNSIKDLHFSTSIIILINLFWGSFKSLLEKLPFFLTHKNLVTTLFIISALVYFLFGIRSRKYIRDYIHNEL